ncbi:hypothetical protein MLD38_019794 [Melastoma candidum]|uniref:Uncharacterized protein n=1 Tax=Melastoma candidum TaxID=119954 RepID=A0ACB9QDV8_9MYRT|nr:hypothetical protein MLD38_019794 [Melastoma candidum]
MEVSNHMLFRQQWDYVTVLGNNGVGRMKVCWDNKRCKVEVVATGNQWIHTKVELMGESVPFLLTFVYGSNDREERLQLWNALLAIGQCRAPWCILGDFNVVRSPNEKLGGKRIWKESENVLNRTMHSLGMDDLRGVGCQFTWSNRRSPPILAKLDRAVVNRDWIETFRLSEVNYLPPTTSDHSACLVRLGVNKRKAAPFKFFDLWRFHPKFKDALTAGWSKEYRGLRMFRLCCKLKDLKVELKKLNREHLCDISGRVEQARTALQALQLQSLAGQPNLVEEQLALDNFLKIARMEESFYKQKARATWLRLGDRNTAYFHGEVNRKANRDAITSIQLNNGDRVADQGRIQQEFIEHFKGLPGDGYHCSGN